MYSRSKLCLPLLFMLIGAPVMSQEWQTEISSALREASESNKNVLLYFSAGESCEECALIEDSVFSDTEFLQFAESRYILTRIAFNGDADPSKKAENLLIVEKYNKDGFFPFVVLVDRNGRKIGNTGIYEGEDAEAFIKKLTLRSR